MSRPHLSVVIPAYNEEARLGPSLARVLDYLDRNRIDGEVLVVDDGSSDGTEHVAHEMLDGGPGRVLVNPENRGKGYSVRQGVLAARGRWVLMSDADLSTPIEEHARLAEVARDRDLDVVIGSRGLPDSKIEVAQNALRQTMGKTFNVVMRIATGLPFSDTQCGFKLMDGERVRPLFERMVVDRFAFDVELLYLCTRFDLSVLEVPVVWRNSPMSRVGLFSDPLNMLYDVLRIRWRFRRGMYNPDSAPTEGGHGQTR
ncbi:MAG: glycosyltransferase family 2 protein [bacterium]|nr:glycosyltransferase family 2 protein [bacterium]